MAIVPGPQGPNGHPMTDDNLLIAMGVYPGIQHINKFGENEDVAANTAEDVWTGSSPYTYPTTATITHVSQTADQEAMRGGRINVQGLDANWELKNQSVLLDGTLTTTAVALGTPLIRVFRASVGSAVALDSSVRIHNAAENVDYAILEVGHNQTMMAQYTIPAGFDGYMVSYYGTVVSDATNNKAPDYVEFHLYARQHTGLVGGGSVTDWLIKHEVAIPIRGSGFQHEFKPYYKFPERTDIRLNAFCKTEPGHIHGGFDIIIVSKTQQND